MSAWVATALSLVGLTLIAAWVPILLRFFRAWKQRHNPVSLAICGVVLLIIYMNVLLIMVSSFKASLFGALLIGLGFNVIACFNIHIAFRWSEKKFHDQRSSVTKVEPKTTGSVATGSVVARPPQK